MERNEKKEAWFYKRFKEMMKDVYEDCLLCQGKGYHYLHGGGKIPCNFCDGTGKINLGKSL